MGKRSKTAGLQTMLAIVAIGLGLLWWVTTTMLPPSLPVANFEINNKFHGDTDTRIDVERSMPEDGATRVRLHNCAAIALHITDADNGQNLQNATVRCVVAAPRPEFRTEAGQYYPADVFQPDVDGMVIIEAQSECVYDIEVMAPGYARVEVPCVASGSTVEIRLSRPGELRGLVTCQGVAVEDVCVRAFGSEGGWSAECKTRADGSFAMLSVAPGDVYCWFLSGKHKTELRTIRVVPNAPTQIDVQLSRGGILAGRVTDAATGQPICGAHISVSNRFQTFVESDARGKFELTGIDINLMVLHLHVRASGYAQSDIVVANQQTGLVEVLMHRGGAITGTMVSANVGSDSVPVILEAVARATLGKGAPAREFEIRRTGWTVSGQSFRLDGLKCGVPYLFSACSPGAASALIELFVRPLEEGEVRDLGALQLEDGHSVSGYVKNQADRPVGGAPVHISSLAASRAGNHLFPVRSQSRITNSDGQFMFNNVAAGVYVVRATGGGLAVPGHANVVVRPDQPSNQVLVRVTTGVLLTGTIHASSGNKFPGAAEMDLSQFVIAAIAQDGQVRSARANTDGVFRLGPLVDGVYSVECVRGPAGWSTVAASNVSTKSGSLRLFATPAARLSGVVVDEAGNAVCARLRLSWSRERASNFVWVGATDSNGKFALDVAPGWLGRVAARSETGTEEGMVDSYAGAQDFKIVV